MTSNEAVSSWRKRSGAAFRLWRHQSSIAPIWTSASGVVRTGRLTAAGAVRRESPMLDEAGPLPRTPRTRREPRAGRGARRPSDRHSRHRPRDRWSSLPAGWSAHRGPVARSRRVLEEGSYGYCTAFIDTRQALRPEPRYVGWQRGRDLVPTPVWSIPRIMETVRAQPGDEQSPCPECLQNAGRTELNREDSRELTRSGNTLRMKRLSPEVARHHQLGKTC